MATKYNPYNAVKKISELKGSYHNAKEKGQDYLQYQQDAVQYYNELRNNGRSDLADELTKTDYTGSLNILSGLHEPKPYDDWYDNLTGDMMKEASKPVQSETVNQIMSAYNADNDRLNGTYTKDANGNVVSGFQTDLYNKASSQMDYIRNLDVTAQPWYENLMAQYQLGGQNAAKGALASGASSNSGNIDSYAAANANRQQLAYTTAGTQAALDTIAQQLAAYQNMYDSARAQLETMGSQANDLLNIGAQYYAADSAERQNALNQAAALEQQKIQAQINELAAQLGYDTAVYQADKTYDAAKLDYDLARYQEQLAAAQQAATQSANQTTNQTANKTTAPVNSGQVKETQENIYDFLDAAYEMYQAGNGSVQSLDDIEQAALAVYGGQYGDLVRTYMTRFKPVR